MEEDKKKGYYDVMYCNYRMWKKKVLKFGDAGISLLYRINHAISVLKDWDWGAVKGFLDDVGGDQGRGC